MTVDHLEGILRKVVSRRFSKIGETRECKLCGYPAHSFANVEFNQSCNSYPFPKSYILVEYFRCQRCELLFTDMFDNWTDEDFRAFIYNDEYILVDPEYGGERGRRMAADLVPTFDGLQDRRILDFGSGSGAFVQELRRHGFRDVTSYDPFSSNILPEGKFDLITCFEVIEHTPQPKGTFEHLLALMARDGCLLIGQTLQPPNITSLREKWWYLAPRNGHCTTYSPETFFWYTQTKGLVFADFGNLFALTTTMASPAVQAIIAKRRPQPRRIVLFAPPPGDGPHASWHDGEGSPSGTFRWTREQRVCFGTFPTPAGSLRVTMRHLGQRSDAFLEACRINVGGVESPVSVHEDDVFALVDLPFEARREINLITPLPQSDLGLGIGSDSRPVGLAVACSES